MEGMKKNVILAAIALTPFVLFAEELVPASVPADPAVPATAQAVQTKIVLKSSECEVTAPIKLFDAAFVDEGDLNGNKYNDDALLGEEVLDKASLEGVSPEAAGEWLLPAPSAPGVAPAYFRVYHFRVASSAFAKAKIRVKCPQKSKLFIGNNEVYTKYTAEDSFENAGTLQADLSLETRSYDIYVKTLVGKDGAVPEGVRVEVETEKGVEKSGLRFLQNGEKRSLNLADYNEGRRIADTAISPNGKYVMAKYSGSNPDGSRLWGFEVVDLKNNNVVYAASGYPAAWMPAGGARVYWASVVLGRKTFYEHDLETQKIRVLASDLPDANNEYIWLPDESGFIVRRTEKYAAPTDQWTRVENLADRRPGYRDRSYLYLYKFEDKVMTRITAGHHTCDLNDISPDGKRILVTTGDVDYTQPEYRTCNLYEIDLTDGKVDKIFDKEPFGSSCVYSPDGNRILILAPANFKNNLGSVLGEGGYPNSFDRQLYIMDTVTREIEPVSKNFDPAITSAEFGGDGRVYLLAEDRDYKHAFIYDPDTKTFEPVKALNNIIDNIYKISVCTRAQDFVPVITAHGGGVANTGKGVAADLSNGNVNVFFEADKPLDSYIEMGTTQDWNFVSKVPESAGDTIYGYYCLPPKFDPAKKYPMIVYYYGGTSPSTRGFNPHYPFLLWASHGYVVYVLNPSGTTGFGQKFSARHVNAWGRITADEIIQGVKQFCDEHPYVDSKKIGCIGASYGGFMTMYLQTRTDIFAAAVSHAGISNIASYWGGGYWGAEYNAIAAANSFPWNNRELFFEQSPLFSAQKINTPILFCHGQKDTNVPPHESHQMFAALRLLGKPTDLITFKDEDHGIVDYARRVQWGKSHMAWFDRYLKDDPDWWFELWPSAKKSLNN